MPVTSSEIPFARFWAQLASLPDWKTVTQQERQRLRAECRQLCFASSLRVASGQQVSIKGQQHLDPDLAYLSRLAQKTILPAMRGDPRGYWALQRKTKLTIKLTPEHIVTWVLTSGSVIEIMTLELLIVWWPTDPCPFLHCPCCSTIFIPVRHQRYCTRQCLERERNKRPIYREAKRIYMRTYMAKKREQVRHATAA